ncbi:MAG: SAM-dependent methyltransferase [Leptothrix sp. (in: Bacteria)]|nr:SAM-dependent methyltransferase [Leptothrix sp. (in: b-proteobacteria)]
MSDAPFRDAAATWNQRFSREGWLFGREPNNFLRERVALLPAAARVLCVADGEGRNSVWLARQGFEVQAFDVSDVAVAKAARLAAEAGVSVDHQVGDFDTWPWPEQAFDAVVAIFIQFADPAMRVRQFAHLQRCLKPGGLLLLQGYTPRQLELKTGGPGVLSHLYTAAMLREAFAAMDIVELVEYEAVLSEGTGHSGPSALAGLAARKRQSASDVPSTGKP